MCDVKEPINSNPLALGLVISGMSLTRHIVPNFLDCKPTHFLNDVSKRFTLTGLTMVSQIGPPVSNTLVELEMSQGEEIVETSVPYVTTVENYGSQNYPSVWERYKCVMRTITINSRVGVCTGLPIHEFRGNCVGC